MTRRSAILVAVGLALAGCRSADKNRPSRDAEGEPASRTKAPSKGWLAGPNPNLDAVDAPPADSWADPRDRRFDVARETRGVLAGFVEDPDGRKVRDVFIEVEPADLSGGGGAPVGVQTDRSGYFLIKGLKPNQAYVLTAQAGHDGKTLGGRAYAQTGTDRSQFIRLSLIEGLTFPGGTRGGPDRPAADAKPATTPPDLSMPPPVLPSGGKAEPRVPEPVRRDPEPPPAARSDLPRTDGAFSPVGPRPDVPRGPATDTPPIPPLRKDLVTEGPPGIWKPPTTSIPTAPPPPSSSAIPAPPPPGRSESRSNVPASEFVLLDPGGSARTFPTGRPNELVLLDFMTTWCVPCKKAIPTLNALHAKHTLNGVEVVGVLCDAAGVAERRQMAAQYKRQNGVRYLLYVEAGEKPGAVARRFDVEGYPTLVLLDGHGQVRWKGHRRIVRTWSA